MIPQQSNVTPLNYRFANLVQATAKLNLLWKIRFFFSLFRFRNLQAVNAAKAQEHGNKAKNSTNVSECVLWWAAFLPVSPYSRAIYL